MDGLSQLCSQFKKFAQLCQGLALYPLFLLPPPGIIVPTGGLLERCKDVGEMVREACSEHLLAQSGSSAPAVLVPNVMLPGYLHTLLAGILCDEGSNRLPDV